MHKRAQSPYILNYTQPHIHFTSNHILHHFGTQIQTSPVDTTLDNLPDKTPNLAQNATPNCRSSQDDHMHSTAQAPLPLSSNSFSSQTFIPKFHFTTHIQMPHHNHTFWAYSSFTLWAGKSSIPKKTTWKFVSKYHHHHNTFQASTSFALWAGKKINSKTPFQNS